MSEVMKGPVEMRRARPLVLMVEECHHDGRETLRRMLEERHDVLTVATAAEAGQRARDRPPELVLVHATTPDAEACFALRELLAHPAIGHVPAIFVSETSDEDGLVRCLELGAADFLSPPFSGRVLLARIERALRDHRDRQALEALAQTDALTGLANFRALSTRLEEELKRASRYQYPIAVVMIDLDNLKAVNDRFGHEVGNRAIASLAQYLRRSLRAVDFAARYGGDEFVVLLPHQTAAEATAFAERLGAGLKVLRVPQLEGGGGRIALTVSIGIAEHRPGAEPVGPARLLEAADAALYEAKRRGRDQAVVLEEADRGDMARPQAGHDS